MKKTASVIFKSALIVIGLISLSMSFYVDGNIIWSSALYFTIQSNALAVVSLILFMFIGDSLFKTLLRGVTLASLALTFAVYNFVLYNIFADWGTAGYVFDRTATHLIMPLGYLIDWLVFDPRCRFKRRHVALWLLYPVVYGIASFVASTVLGATLYFFFSASGGVMGAILWILAIGAGLCAVCFMFVAIDNRFGRRGQRIKLQFVK